MRTSFIIIVIAVVSALSAMLVLERQFSNQISKSAQLTQPDPVVVNLIQSNDNADEATATTKE